MLNKIRIYTCFYIYSEDGIGKKKSAKNSVRYILS